jgi:hypothetical protein
MKAHGLFDSSGVAGPQINIASKSLGETHLL